jgi:hypothetical protein
MYAGVPTGPVDLRQAWQGSCAAQDGDAGVEHLHQPPSTSITLARISAQRFRPSQVDAVQLADMDIR